MFKSSRSFTQMVITFVFGVHFIVISNELIIFIVIFNIINVKVQRLKFVFIVYFLYILTNLDL